MNKKYISNGTYYQWCKCGTKIVLELESYDYPNVKGGNTFVKNYKMYLLDLFTSYWTSSKPLKLNLEFFFFC